MTTKAYYKSLSSAYRHARRNLLNDDHAVARCVQLVGRARDLTGAWEVFAQPNHGGQVYRRSKGRHEIHVSLACTRWLKAN